MELLLLFWVLLSFIPAAMASRKGRSVAIWFVVSLLVSPLLAFASIASARDLTRLPCPYCAEAIKIQATVCPHCRGTVELWSGGAKVRG